MIGVLGVSWLLAVTASGVAEIAIDRRASHGIALASWVASIAGSGYLLSSVRWAEPTGEARKVAIYQPNIALEDTWDRNNAPILLNDFLEHAKAYAPSSDLVVWPEGALPFTSIRLPVIHVRTATHCGSNEGTIVTGMPTRSGSRRFNSIVSVGQSSQTYNKQKLVPFGEFVPLEESLRGASTFSIAHVQLLKGRRVTTPALQQPGIASTVYLLRDCSTLTSLPRARVHPTR